MNLIKDGLPPDRPPRSRICFVSYAYADLSLPKRFDTIFDIKNPDRHWAIESRIVAVTQQMGKPFDEVPHGWKTICLIVFPQGVPEIIASLPVVDVWRHTWTLPLGLCDRDTYLARRSQ